MRVSSSVSVLLAVLAGACTDPQLRDHVTGQEPVDPGPDASLDDDDAEDGTPPEHSGDDDPGDEDPDDDRGDDGPGDDGPGDDGPGDEDEVDTVPDAGVDAG